MAEPITLTMMRQSFYSAVVCDALDSVGYTRQSPRVPIPPLTTDRVLVGRCKTTLWADMFHEDPKPYELELKAVDSCRPDDVLIAAAGGSMRSGIWGELLSTAARNSGTEESPCSAANSDSKASAGVDGAGTRPDEGGRSRRSAGNSRSTRDTGTSGGRS